MQIDYEKVPSNDVNFEKMFQDQLPSKAIDLREFLRKYKEKDESKEFSIEERKQGAF